ncbi:MAG: amidase [Gordonia sp.]|nr:amidase [Gordonia sp. (in: high G+C Gram-positive bacteria)]
MTAVEIAARVRAGQVDPVAVTRESLERIAQRDGAIGAFVKVRADKAIAEAELLTAHPDVAKLPLAGVPIAIKDNVPVAGEPMTIGSEATSRAPQLTDHTVVRRLRAAGAVVVGLTAVPELCMWGTTDNPATTTRNPWNEKRTPGGSSGGSAAAVASGQVVLAHGNDGLGSIRIPAADCGLFGIKPGLGVVPREFGGNGWFNMSENGPLATTVADAALMLGVMADDLELARAGADAAPGHLRIVVAENFPLAVGKADKHWAQAQASCSGVLADLGHRVPRADLPYPTNPAPLLFRWFAGAAADAESIAEAGGDLDKLQRRSKTHTAIGRAVSRFDLVHDVQVSRVEQKVLAYLDRNKADLLLTPTLATPPLKAQQWSAKGWASNIWANVNYAPYAGLFNLLGWPAMSVPFGVHPVSRTPMAVQFAGRPGSEALLLKLAAQLEIARPWQKVAPGF